jgi:class 3 adenylate cyclase
MSALPRYPKSGPAGVTPALNRFKAKGVEVSKTQTHQSLVPVKLLIVVIDLAGFTKAAQSAGDVKIVAFLQDYYAACETALSEKGGTVIKFMGDACLSVFPPEHTKFAIEGIIALQQRIIEIAASHGLAIVLGANVHLTSAIEVEFGATKRKDVIGRGVNQTFLLGRGAGIRISEPVYRALPSAMRSPWNKHKPPAVYHLGSTEGIYEGLGKSPDTNAARW